MACFNPRTRVGCDVLCVLIGSAVSLFQSTHPRGVRRYVPYRLLWDDWVSIHAPAWGATRPKLFTMFKAMRFQSTHPRGVRRRFIQRNFMPLLFQSTHPRGVRRIESKPAEIVVNVSIHAPAWGATEDLYVTMDPLPVSIHAPAWGATVSMFYPVDSRD